MRLLPFANGEWEKVPKGDEGSFRVAHRQNSISWRRRLNGQRVHPVAQQLRQRGVYHAVLFDA